MEYILILPNGRKIEFYLLGTALLYLEAYGGRLLELRPNMQLAA